jgi:hypothetical protein
MIQLKDVIQYYIGQRCVHAWYNEWHEQYDRAWVLTSIDYSTPNHYRIENPEDDFTWTDSIKLILRKLEDMTGDEYRTIKDQLSIDVVGAVRSGLLFYSDKKPWVLVLENRLHTNTLLFNDGLILLKQGFDLFGCIDRGEAVDQKTLKQKA